MESSDKVIWTEGMFLTPQHFQQHTRYVENLIFQKTNQFGTYNFGIFQLQLDYQLLKLGKIAILSCQAILPDGTLIDTADNANALLPVIDIPTNLKNAKIYLAVLLKQPGLPEINLQDKQDETKRYKLVEQDVFDNTILTNESTLLQLGKLNLRLLTEQDDRSAYSCLEIARVIERKIEGTVILDEQFIPPSLSCRASSKLSNFLVELLGLLHHRGEFLAARLTDKRQLSEIDEMSDFLLLQVVNRYELIVKDLCQHFTLHPYQLFKLLLQLLGELSTFTRHSKRPPDNLSYNHFHLETTFNTIFIELRQSLSLVPEQTAIALELQEQNYGIWAAPIGDKNLLKQGTFILATKANLSIEQMRSQFPAQIKAASIEHIRELVTRALPGILLRPLPIIPRQIPFNTGFCYFELDKNSPIWDSLSNSAGIAFHIGDDFPGLKLELWVIRETGD